MKSYWRAVTNWFRTRESFIVTVICALTIYYLNYSNARSLLALVTAVSIGSYALVALVCHLYNLRKYGIKF